MPVVTLLKMRPTSAAPAGPRRPVEVLLAATVALAVAGIGQALIAPAGPGPICSPAPVVVPASAPVDSGVPTPPGGGGGGAPMDPADAELVRLAVELADRSDLAGADQMIC